MVIDNTVPSRNLWLEFWKSKVIDYSKIFHDVLVVVDVGLLEFREVRLLNERIVSLNYVESVYTF